MVDTWRVLFDTCQNYHCLDGLWSRRPVLGTKMNTQQLTAYCGGTAPGQVVRSRGAGLQIPLEGTPDRCQLSWGLSFLSPWLIWDVVHLSSTLGRMEVALLETGRNVIWASS